MKSILILFAHPRFEDSFVHQGLINAVVGHEKIFIHDLYQTYPDFIIDVEKEQALLAQHDVIIWQHPFYWYSAPPLIKQWIDLVLEYGWAYGKNGTALQNKWFLSCLSTGGKREVYASSGANRFSIAEFLRPFEQTAVLCKANYLPPFVIHGAHKIDRAQAHQYGLQYLQCLQHVQQALSPLQFQHLEYLNNFKLPQ